MKKRKRAGICSAILAVLLLICFCGCSSSDSKVQDNQVASTPYGNFVGLTQESGVVSFLGVPYAKQPVGELRWKEAQPMDKSDECIKAYKYGNSAIQPIDEYERASFAQQGEDCLTLNVWTRDVGEKKPVMVFIHGGANVSGGTADPMYDGENFVENNDVVMVSFNYRLGAFGFLDLSEIGGKEYEHSRNLGILDQIAALKWINENIESFGGDPENITVFGESAGGSAIIRLMSTPLAEGLFDKGIIESGGPASIKAKGDSSVDETEQSRQIAQKFLEITGKETVEGLQELKASEVQAYADQLADEIGDSMDVSTWGAIADGYAVPLDVYKNIKEGVGKDVKVLIGTNRDEINYFKLYDPDLEQTLEEEYPGGTILGRDFSENKEIADQYIESQADNPEKYTAFAGEYWIKQPSVIFAQIQSAYNDVFMYQWNWESKNEGLGACHASELPFVFGNFDAATAIAYAGEDLPEGLCKKVQASWTAFATTGNPGIKSETKWPLFTKNNRETMIIDDKDWKVVNNPDPDGCEILQKMFEITE